jgi:putative intracellular protease/amidase
MGEKLIGKRVAFLAADGVEQVELTEPWKAVEGEGGEPELVSLEDGEIQGFEHLDKADSFEVDSAVADADASDRCLRLRRPGAARWRRQPRLPAHERGRRVLRAGFLRGRQAGRRDLPRALDPGRSGRGA